MDEQRSSGDADPVQRPEPLDTAGTVMSLVARLGRHDDDLVVIRGSFAPGTSIPVHTHPDVECLYVLGGSVDVYLGTGTPRWHTVGEGESIFVEADVKHAIRNTSGETVDLVVVTTVRLARFLAEIGRPEGEVRSEEERIALFHRKGTEYGYRLYPSEGLDGAVEQDLRDQRREARSGATP